MLAARQTKIIEQLIGLIDLKINGLVNAILHHSEFQALEARWRGLQMLVEAADSPRVQIRVLDLSFAELNKDITNAIEFDQSQVFKKVYSAEYDQAGGQPYGLLIGDYYFSHKPVDGARDGMELLAGITQIAAAAFVPFIASLTPAFFGLDEFTEFQVPLRVDDLFTQVEHHRWRRLRKDDDARFLGLTLPRVLMRVPYNADGVKMQQRFYREKINKHSDYLWGSAAFAFGCVAIRCFKETGWFADIRGIQDGGESGGVVELARNYFTTDKFGFMPKSAVEYQFTDMQEKLLSEAGFLVIRDNRYIEKGVFSSSQSVQIPQKFTRNADAANANARISTMLHYVLCVSRFAHYVKVIARDKVGSFIGAEDCERYLARWLQSYCSTTQGESSAARACYPLNDAKVEVEERPGMPGKYNCVIHLKPQYQLDVMETYLKLVTDVKLNG